MRPFEGIFGNSAEVRLIEFLLPLRELEFNVVELAAELGVSVVRTQRILNRLVSWDIIKIIKHPEKDSRILRHTNYTINYDSPILQSILDFNNAITGVILKREGIEFEITEVDCQSCVHINNADKIFEQAKTKKE